MKKYQVLAKHEEIYKQRSQINCDFTMEQWGQRFLNIMYKIPTKRSMLIANVTNSNRLVFLVEFNDKAYSIIVKPHLVEDIKVAVTGRGPKKDKEHLGKLFYDFLIGEEEL